MLKTIPSKIKYIHKFLGIPDKILKDIETMSFKKDDIYQVENRSLKFKKTEVKYVKNIFTIYSKEVYALYKDICELINEACELYEIDKSKQMYMIYGKTEKYNKDKNGTWYDYPGINIPFLHGFYILPENGGKIFFQNNNTIVEQEVTPGDLIINKPTDIIKFEVEDELNIIEFYISPIFALENNEPGVWIPVA
jgi:hypothetical protein